MDGIRIVNNGKYLSIFMLGHLLLLNKTQIRSVKPIKDSLHIDTGNGPLDQLFIPLASVVEPAGLTSIEDLQHFFNATLNGTQDVYFAQTMDHLNALQDMLVTVNTSIGDTSSNEQRFLGTMTTILTDIKSILDGAYSAYKEPLRIDQTNPDLIYKGYPSVVSANTSEPSWAITRTKISGGVIGVSWANGNRNFVNAWDDRYSLTYLPG